ncbi:hypothetical protein R9R95_23850 [Escherichia coli]|nr:hypothetical protein [Escherichia coli]
MKLTLLSAMLMTAVVGITSANAADYKKLLLPPMQLIRGLAVGCHVTKDLHSQFNIIYIMRTNINQGRIQSLAVHDCSAH